MGKNIYSIDNISKRSKGVIENLGGADEVLKYYIENKDFYKIRGVGNLVNYELTNFCKEYIKTNQINIEYLNKVEIPKVNIENVKQLEYYYINYKLLLSVRALNALKKLEQIANFSLSIDKKIEYFQQYFINDYEFFRIRNIGEKSLAELINLKIKLVSTLTNEAPSQDFDIKTSFSEIYEDIFNDDNFESILVENKIDLSKVILILLKKHLKTVKQNKIFELVFYSDDNITKQEILLQSECTKEYLRLIIQDIIGSLKHIMNTVTSKLNPSLVYTYPYNSDYFYVPKVESFVFNNTYYSPNIKLSKELIKVMYNDYFAFEDLLDKLENNLSFNHLNIMISNDFITKTRFFELIVFLNQEIYNFEIIGFEYNLRILINRFYVENNIILSNDLVPRVFNLINLLVKKEWKINYKLVNKEKKKEHKTNILYLLEDYLINKGEAEKTSLILDYINENGFNISLIELLDILNSSSDFARIGTGFWIHKNLIDTSKIQGSIVDIVIKMLNENERPIHISEIFDMISPYRKVTIKSLITNILVTGKDIIMPFNCNFFGLKNKNYSEYWLELKTFVYSKNKPILLDKNLSLDEKIRKLEINGVPELQTRYLLSKKYK